MQTEPTTELTIQKAITCICQLDSGLDYIIKNMSDQSEDKDMLILLKELSGYKLESLEQEFARLAGASA